MEMMKYYKSKFSNTKIESREIIFLKTYHPLTHTHTHTHTHKEEVYLVLELM